MRTVHPVLYYVPASSRHRGNATIIARTQPKPRPLKIIKLRFFRPLYFIDVLLHLLLTWCVYHTTMLVNQKSIYTEKSGALYFALQEWSQWTFVLIHPVGITLSHPFLGAHGLQLPFNDFNLLFRITKST